MRWIFKDNTYTGLCDLFNELDIVNLVELECSNDEVIWSLIELMIKCNMNMVAVRSELADMFDNSNPIAGYCGDDISMLVVKSDLSELERDVRQVVNYLRGKNYKDFNVTLLQTSYRISVTVI